MSMLEHALHYASQGWAVLPLHSIEDGHCTCGNPDCNSQGKHPLISGGSRSATTNSSIIEGWWHYHPNANIGIATGSASGLIVVDIDHGPGKNGYQNIAALEAEHGALPYDTCVRTGSQGLHIYLSLEGQLIPNSASKLAAHVDVRGEGGYVVAPPSLHLSGKTYEWTNPNAE